MLPLQAMLRISCEGIKWSGSGLGGPKRLGPLLISRTVEACELKFVSQLCKKTQRNGCFLWTYNLITAVS